MVIVAQESQVELQWTCGGMRLETVVGPSR